MKHKTMKKDVFRKNVIDVVMILPTQEGSIEAGKMVTQRISMKSMTNIDLMTKVFRQMWVSLVLKDEEINKHFKEFFENQKKEQDKMMEQMQKMMPKTDNKLSSKLKKLLKNYSGK